MQADFPDARLYGNFVRWVREQASASRNGQVLDTPGGALVSCGSAFPAGPFNAAIRTNPAESADRFLADARRAFARWKRGFTVYVQGDDPELEDVCRAQGFLRYSELAVLALAKPPRFAARDPALELRRALDADLARAFVDTVAASYSTEGVPGDVVEASFGEIDDRLEQDDAMRLFHLLHAGRSVASGLLLFSDGVAGLYWIGTPPAHRGRGFGSALTDLLIEHAFDSGAGAVTLQAAPGVASLYRRLGFQQRARLLCCCRARADGGG